MEQHKNPGSPEIPISASSYSRSVFRVCLKSVTARASLGVVCVLGSSSTPVATKLKQQQQPPTSNLKRREESHPGCTYYLSVIWQKHFPSLVQLSCLLLSLPVKLFLLAHCIYNKNMFAVPSWMNKVFLSLCSPDSQRQVIASSTPPDLGQKAKRSSETHQDQPN